MDKTKEDNLNNVLKEIRKNFGAGAIMTLNSSDIVNLPRVSSGVMAIDGIIGGGYPLGRIIEIYGPESSGKTTIALKAIASVQKCNGVAAFIDAEHALDPTYAKNLGVDIDNLLISQPDNGEMALDITEALVRSGSVNIIVIDSVAALVPKAEIDGDMGDSHVGLHARLMSQAMRKLTGAIATSQCVVIFINQIREKVGVIYGNPETTTGGRALKFYASIRIDIRKKDSIKNGTDFIGNIVHAKIVKNKTYPPFKEANFDIIYGKGPDDYGFVIDRAAELNIIDKGGAWIMYNGNRYHGKNEFKDYLQKEEGQNDYETIKQKVLSSLMNVTESVTH